MDNRSDPRVNDWFLMKSPLPTISLIAVYIYFVKVSLHQRLSVFTLMISFTVFWATMDE